MVTTRSGKSIDSKDENSNRISKKCTFQRSKSSSQECKKARVLSNISNSQIDALNTPTDFNSGKRIVMSADERSMNGAPEGEIFDMVILEDSELTSFDSEESAFLEYNKQVALYDSSSLWAEKYEVLTNFRRVIEHHKNLLIEKKVEISDILKIVLLEVQSLRSCTVRNSLKCINNVIQSSVHYSDSVYQSIVSALFKRTASGPKFICDLAFTILQETMKLISPILFIETALEFGGHKNAEVVARAVSLGSSCILKLSKATIEDILISKSTEKGRIESDVGSVGEQVIAERNQSKSMLELICIGVYSKRSSAKEDARKALRYLLKTSDRNIVETAATRDLSPSQSQELKLTIDVLLTKNQTKPSFKQIQSSFKKSTTSLTGGSGFVIYESVDEGKVPNSGGNRTFTTTPSQHLSSTMSGLDIKTVERSIGSKGSGSFRDHIQNLKRQKKQDSCENDENATFVDKSRVMVKSNHAKATEISFLEI